MKWRVRWKSQASGGVVLIHRNSATSKSHGKKLTSKSIYTFAAQETVKWTLQKVCKYVYCRGMRQFVLVIIVMHFIVVAWGCCFVSEFLNNIYLQKLNNTVFSGWICIHGSVVVSKGCLPCVAVFLIHFKMAQWERLCNLSPPYRQQLDELYDKDVLPMEVRHYLAGWIERQEWWGHLLGLHITPSSDHKPLHVCHRVLFNFQETSSTRL